MRRQRQPVGSGSDNGNVDSVGGQNILQQIETISRFIRPLQEQSIFNLWRQLAPVMYTADTSCRGPTHKTADKLAKRL